MAIPLPLSGQIVQAILQGPESSEYASLSMAGIDPVDPSNPLLMPERAFQYWPDSITDTIDIGWNFKEVAGASHALAQWGSNGGRTITFEVTLARYMKPKPESVAEIALSGGYGVLTGPNTQMPKDNTPFNVDIREEIHYLRGYCYPTYSTKNEAGVLLAYPPPIAILCAPGVGLNESGDSCIFVIMTGCDVTYTLLFPDGTPRLVKVALTLRQVVQKQKSGVHFVGHGKGYHFGDRFFDGEGLKPGAGRTKNKITIDSVMVPTPEE